MTHHITQAPSAYAHTEEAKYIIAQNEKFHEINESLMRVNIENQATFASMEDEQDKYDERVRYLRGLLKNFVELKNLSDKQLVKETKISSSLSSYIRNDHKIRKNELMGFTGVNILLLIIIMLYSSMTVSTLFMTYITIYVIYIRNYRTDYYKNVPNIIRQLQPLRNESKVLKKEQQELERSCDFINEYVDAI